MVKLITIIALLLCAISLSNAATQTKQANWSRLGPNECYKQTCGSHEFCSDNPVRGQGCRNCSEIVGSSEDENSWCHPIRFEEFKRKFPSCESLCWIDRYQTLLGKVEGLSNTTEYLNHSLREEREKSARLDRELTETGKALNKALNDPTGLKNLNATYEATVIKLNETAEALEKSTGELAASRTSENKAKEDLNTQRAKFLETEAELSKTKKELNTTKESLSEARSGQHQAGEEKQKVLKENDKLRAHLKKTTDERQLFFTLFVICAVLVVVLLAVLCISLCLCHRRVKKLKRTLKKHEIPLSQIYTPPPSGANLHRGPAQAEGALREPLLQPGNTTLTNPINNPPNGQPKDRVQPQGHQEGMKGRIHRNNLNANVLNAEKVVEKKVNATPGPSQPASQEGSSTNNESPYSSTHTCSSEEGEGVLAPSGDRAASHLNDPKDFTKTSPFHF